jgi:hypothetical protein
MKYSNKYRFNPSSKLNLLLPLLLASLLVFDPFVSQLLKAQENSATETPKARARLYEMQWKAVEGIFQNPDNDEMYVQFTAKDTVLLAKLLWNNNELPLTPESELVFVNKEAGEDGRPLRVSFSKDSTGQVEYMSIGNNQLWKRAKAYKPVVKTEMLHSPGQLKPFEGLYELQDHDDRFIQFYEKDNKLVLKQHWDGGETRFVPQTELDFFSKETPLFSLTFTKNKDGIITEVLAFKRDRWIKVKKFQPGPAILKMYEGKYQSKDDPDNLIQIIAKGNNIIVKQLWDGKETLIEPQTETYFYNDEKSYPLQFIKDKDGKVSQALVLGMDLFNKLPG